MKFDEGAGDILMCTFSAPFHRDGVFRGMAGQYTWERRGTKVLGFPTFSQQLKAVSRLLESQPGFWRYSQMRSSWVVPKCGKLF